MPSLEEAGDPRITWMQGEARPGPRERIGVLEVCEDGECRAVLAERVEIDGRCHVLLARRAWGGKESLSTRWWSLTFTDGGDLYTVRNGSCGDSLLASDVDRITAAIEDLKLTSREAMIVVDDGPSVFPWLAKK